MNNLKQARLSKGYTLEQIAQKLSTTRQALSMYENNKREVSNSILLKLSEIYGVSTDYLLGAKEVQKNITQNNDLGLITPQQNTLFKMIMQLDNDRFYMVYGYTERLLKEMIA